MPLSPWLRRTAEQLGIGAAHHSSHIPSRDQGRVRLAVEALEDRCVPTAGPSGLEAYLFQLINRMRTDPQGELMRLVTALSPIHSNDPHINASLEQYQVNGSALASQWGSLRPLAPLAWNDSLAAAAALHNMYMIAHDQQSHQLPGEPSLAERVENAGYTGWTQLGENVFAYAMSVLHAHAAFAIDWGIGPDGLQAPEHRNNIMNPTFTEVGISVVAENDPNTQVGPLVVTEDFGARGNQSYVVGSVFVDADRDTIPSWEEATNGVMVQISTDDGIDLGSQITNFGFFQFAVGPGEYTLTFTGWPLLGPIVRHVVVGEGNVLIELNIPPDLQTEGSNHAPVLNVGGLSGGSSILEGTRNPAGTLVRDLLDQAVTDQDVGDLKGIAVFRASHTDQGDWQYSTDQGRTWFSLDTVSLRETRLLKDTDLVRFVPEIEFSGTVHLDFRAWDGTMGQHGGTTITHLVGGFTAFSRRAGAFQLIVQNVNDAPILNVATTRMLTPTASRGAMPTGNSVAFLLGDSVLDYDQDAKTGIAVVGLNANVWGVWQYSLDGGNTWTNFGPVSAGHARLLRSEDWVRFLPRAGTTGMAGLFYRAWDQTTGIAGSKANLLSLHSVGNATAYSSHIGKACVVVNNAPRLNTTPLPLLTTILEDATNPAGDLVARFASPHIGDSDPYQVKGIAITGLGSTENGRWQYCLNGVTWLDIGDVSPEQAFLLRGRDKVRFIPNADYYGSATLQFHAWDGTQGVTATYFSLIGEQAVGGATAFSVESSEAILAIAPVNDAPILDENGQPTLTPVAMNATNPTGDKVAKLLELVVKDPDPEDPQGIAIIGLAGTPNGIWQYSTNDGRTWITIRNVSGSRALLLRDVDRIRFVPNRNFTGQASLMFRAWDQTNGTFGDVADLSLINSVGGVTAFSSSTLSGTVGVV